MDKIPMDTIKLLSDESSSDDDEALNQRATPLVQKYSSINPFEVPPSDDDDDDDDDDDGDAKRSGRRGNGNYYLYLASSMAAIGGITFGYDMGIVSGALLQLRSEMSLSCFQQEVIVSAMLIGALLGSFVGGFLLDWFGRRRTLICNAGVFIIGGLVMALAVGYRSLVAGRLVVGIAVAISGIGECVYVAEISPAEKRGRLVLLNETGICSGILLSYLVNFFFIEVDEGWRYMFLLSSVPAVIQAVGMFTLPPSPRYLLMSGKDTEAYQTLQLIRRTSEVGDEWADLKEALEEETNHARAFLQLCGTERNLRGRLLIAIGLVVFENLTGQTTVIYYAPTIFQLLGFSSKFSATLATVGLGITKLLASIVALFLVDVVGRRRLLLCGGILMAVVIAILGVVVQVLPPPDSSSLCSTDLSQNQDPISFQPNNSTNVTDSFNEQHLRDLDRYSSEFLEKRNQRNLDNFNSGHNRMKRDRRGREINDDGGHLVEVFRLERDANKTDSPSSLTPSTPPSAKAVAVMSLMLYVFAFSLGYGPVVWLLLSEFFPVDVRGRASSLANSMNWMTNIVINLTFLDILNNLGPSTTFLGFGAICILSVLYVLCFIPETKGRSLESISQELNRRRCCRCIHCGGSMTEICDASYSDGDIVA